MTIGSTQDRRQFIQDKLAAMEEQNSSERLIALREIIANGLSFSPVNEASVKADRNHLPDTGTVIGKLNNDYGPDYTAMHFDLSTGIKTGRVNPRVTLPQIQEANSVVQQYTQEETNPLLIFTLPDDSGLQFATGNLSPGNPNRLDDILRVSTYWDNLNRTALDCLDRIGGAIAQGEWPEQAFKLGLSVQPVTQEFFTDYKASYDKTVTKLSETMDKEEAEQFTQTLFNRLLFIHFISKKGWTTWDGNPDYLKALWADYQKNQEQTNFHSDRLTVLFHEGMNTPEDQRDPTTEDAIGQVPFLNGGLFDRNELDLNGVHVDDELISGIVGREGLFSQYNFTVTEASPLDIEVAVDPEMLGKLFEETVNERHSNGAYYTPRPVVSFMCREALKGYIASRDIAGLDDAKIAELVDGRIPEVITPQQALEVANSVAGIKVVDPACGSGAFLLGMLQEILTLNDTLFRAGKTPESLYQQKLDIITNNIYGADKDRLAVSTAMLRLWLSLAVDYDGEGSPDPLPNLDMKLTVGDSIAGPNPQQFDLTRHSIASSDLQERIADYTTAQGEEKAALKREIEEIKRKLRKEMGDAPSEEAVEWRIDFADVMLNGGFDVLIANPPYLRHEDIKPKEYKKTLVRQFEGNLAGRSDLYCYFYVRGIELLKNRGMHIFVCSNTWLDSQFGVKLQDYLMTNARIHSIMESAVERQFSTAAINTIISKIERTTGTNTDDTLFVSLREEFEQATSDPMYRREIKVSKGQLLEASSGERKWGGRFLRAPDVYHQMMEGVASANSKLSDYVRGERYLNTGGADGFFILNDVVPNDGGIMKATITSREGKDDGFPEFNIESQFLKPGYRGSSPNLVEIKEPDCFVLVIPPDTNLKEFEVSQYVAWGEKVGFHQRSVPSTQSPWWRPPLQAQQGAILLWPRSHSESHVCYFNPKQLISLRFFRLHPTRDEDVVPVLAVLNSTVFALLKEVHGRRGLGLGALETGLIDILPLPFPILAQPIREELTLAIEPLLNRSIGKLDQETEEADRHTLDEAVLKAFGLDPALGPEVRNSVRQLVNLRTTKSENIS